MIKPQDYLRQLGFSANKAELYCALLKRRSGSASELAAAAGIQRTTAYDILRELCEDNMAVMSISGRKRIYHANPPQELHRVLSEKLTQLETVLPVLQSLYFHNEQIPRIRFYEGIEGVRQIYEETIRQADSEYYYIGGMTDYAETVGPDFVSDLTRRRVRKKIWSNGIRIRENETSIGDAVPGKENYRRIRYISGRGMAPSAMLTLFENKTAITSTARENFGVIIESAELYSILKLVWDMLWQTAEEPDFFEQNK